MKDFRVFLCFAVLAVLWGMSGCDIANQPNPPGASVLPDPTVPPGPAASSSPTTSPSSSASPSPSASPSTAFATAIVDAYIQQVAAYDFRASVRSRSLVNSSLSGPDLQALKNDIINRISSDQLLTSGNTDQIVGSMMNGVATGVGNLLSGSLANDYKTGSTLVSVAIKSSVQTLVAHPEELSSASVKLTDVVGSVVKTGVTSLSAMSASDVVSVQQAIIQSVKAVAAATAGVAGTASEDFVKAAVTATVQVAVSTASGGSSSLVQAAFRGASSALAASGTATQANLSAIVSSAIANSVSSSAAAEQILVQAAIGLGAGESALPVSAVQAILQTAASDSAAALQVAVNSSQASAVAAESTPVASIACDLASGSELPYLASGYPINIDCTGSTMAGTSLSLSCPGLDTSSFSAGRWSSTVNSGIHTFTLTVRNTGGQKLAYASLTIRIAAAPGSTPSASPDSVPVTGLTLSASELALTAGCSSVSLIAEVAPANASNKTVRWVSSDALVASVDANGKVTPIKAGNATVTAVSADGLQSANCAVTVDHYPVGNYIVYQSGDSKDRVKYNLGLPATVPVGLPVTWSSGNAAISAGGVVTRPAEGASDQTVTMTATLGSGDRVFTETVDLIVKAYPIGGEGSLSFGVESNLAPSATIYQYGASTDIAQGETLTVYASTSVQGTVSYSWYLDNSLLSGQNSYSVKVGAGLGTGRHSLFVIIGTSRGFVTDSFDFSVLPSRAGVSVVDPAGIQLSLYGMSAVEQRSSTYLWAYTSVACDAYAWYIDGTLKSGAASSSIDLTGLAAGRHTVMASVRVGNVVATQSTALTLTSTLTGISAIDPATQHVNLSNVPSSLASGSKVTVYASATVTPDLYIWYLDGKAVATTGNGYLTIGEGLSIGRHTIMVLVKNGTVLTTASGYFTVQ